MTKKKRDINDDRKRVQYLAATIFPGDAFMMSEGTDVAQVLIELVSIIARYDEQDERDFLIYGMAEAMYPTTDEGSEAIEAWIARLASPNASRRAKR